MHKEHVGYLIKSIRSIKSIQIAQREDFGKGCQCVSFFYDSAYQPVKRDSPVPINEAGQCVITNEIPTDSVKEAKKWLCSSECKPFTDTEVDAILALKADFEKSIQDIRHALDECDSNGHYSKVIEFSSVDLKGHPLVCSSSSGGCQSQLRVLRVAATHFPVLRQFLHDVHSVIKSHMCIFEIDKALCSGNYHTLMQAIYVETFDALLSNDVKTQLMSNAQIWNVQIQFLDSLIWKQSSSLVMLA